MSRIVCNFSCGAASAVATKLVLAEFGASRDVQIVNAFIAEEHADNRRFLADCEVWFGRPVTVLRDEKYGASARQVFRRERFLKSQGGAPCSRALKRRVLDAWSRPTDTVVLGYTSEEGDRYDRFLDANNIKVLAPMIDRGLTKADCLAIVARAGIELPLMYRLGFQNANCVGCVKGGEGYWNKVRQHFPADFEEMAQIQETIGPGANLFRNRKTGVRFSLRELKPDAGRYQDEIQIECGVFCEMAEQDLREPDEQGRAP
jgi:hypothetical protein